MHNPKAGRGGSCQERLDGRVGERWASRELRIDKEERIQESSEKLGDVVLVAGGDGTVGKVGRELIDSGVPLGVLPLGTANNLACSLGFTASPEEIVAGLESGEKRAFDIGLARGLWGKHYFFESAGGGLLADYLREAKDKPKKTKKLSEEQEMRRHVSLLRRMLHDYSARKWKMDIDGNDISDDYILWEAMNIRSVGPLLYLASQAATKDGRLDFVCAREEDRSLLMQYLDARLAGQRVKFPLPLRRFRKLNIVWENSTLHFDDKVWPSKNKKAKTPSDIEIMVKPSALVILQPGR